MDTFELTRSGRRISVHRVTEGDGRTVLFLHAAPGAGNFDPDPDETARHRVTLLAPDRPGYGRSEPVTGDAWSSVDSAADDAAAVLDELGLSGVGVAGWSAGGRVALALAARRPELVERVAVVATPAPNEAVPWIPPEQAAGLEAMKGMPAEEVHAALTGMLGQSVPEDPASDAALEMVGGSPADAGVLGRPGVRERLGAMLAAAFAQGAVGMAQDIAGYGVRPWGFELADARARTLLLYGSADPVAGPAHGRWYQRQLPDARLEVAPDAGHLLIVPIWRRVLSHLAPGEQRRQASGGLA